MKRKLGAHNYESRPIKIILHSFFLLVTKSPVTAFGHITGKVLGLLWNNEFEFNVLDKDYE